MMPLALIYVAVGLMFVTVAIDIFGAHLRRVHSVGQKLRNVAGVRVWFGGKRYMIIEFHDASKYVCFCRLKVSDILSAVCDELAVSPSELDKLDLDKLVNVS
jgi:hypothetical protein